jgi:hypothetical protein
MIGAVEAQRLLAGLEAGTLGTVDAGQLVARIDPVLAWAVIGYLRASYPASDPAASAVLERVVALTRTDPEIVAAVRAGESDPVARWFLDVHGFGAWRGRGRDMIEAIVEKLES